MQISVNKCPICEGTMKQPQEGIPFFVCSTCLTTFEMEEVTLRLDKKGGTNPEQIGTYSIRFTVGDGKEGKEL